MPLEVSARKPDHRGSDESRLQYHQPDEDILNRDIIPDRRLSTPEASAATDEMVTQVEFALLRTKQEDREAFLLFAVEGFSPDEIAAISERPATEVRHSIAVAREHLQKALPAPNEFKDRLLEQSKIA